MKEIIDTMLSPVWLVTVLVASLVINVFSSYLKDAIDWLWKRADRKLSASSTTRAHHRAALIQKLREDAGFRSGYMILAERDRTQSDVSLWMGVVTLVFLALRMLDTQHKLVLFAFDGPLGPDFSMAASSILSMLIITLGMQWRMSYFKKKIALIRATVPTGQPSDIDYASKTLKGLKKIT